MSRSLLAYRRGVFVDEFVLDDALEQVEIENFVCLHVISRHKVARHDIQLLYEHGVGGYLLHYRWEIKAAQLVELLRCGETDIRAEIRRLLRLEPEEAL